MSLAAIAQVGAAVDRHASRFDAIVESALAASADPRERARELRRHAADFRVLAEQLEAEAGRLEEIKVKQMQAPLAVPAMAAIPDPGPERGHAAGAAPDSETSSPAAPVEDQAPPLSPAAVDSASPASAVSVSAAAPSSPTPAPTARPLPAVQPPQAVDPRNLLTNSRLKTARRCLREHQIAYELGYRPVRDSDAARFGDLVHKGLEAWFRAPTGADRLAAALAALDRAIADLAAPPPTKRGAQPVEVDPFEAAKARVLLVGYHARWVDEPLEVLAVEVEFQAPLLNPATGAPSKIWTLGGKLDAIVRDLRSSRVLIVEHKTSSEDISSGSDYWRRLRMDGQVSTYFAGARALGFDPAGCLYDVLGKPALRPSKANTRRAVDETPDEYATRIADAIAEEPARFFARGEVARLDDDLEAWARDVWNQSTVLRDVRREGLDYRNPDACIRFGATCPYFAACSGEASLDDDTRYRRLEHIHPELTKAAAPAQEATHADRT